MKKVQVDGLGEVTLKKSAKAKYIKLRVEPFKGVVVTVPTYLNYEFGLNAIMGKYDWLSGQMAEVKKKERQLLYKKEDFPLFTKNYEVRLESVDVHKPYRKFRNGIACLYLPQEIEFEDIAVQQYISDSVNKVLRSDAKMYLVERINSLADKFNLTVNRITIRDTKTRWGSCSYQNNISLSFHLMKLPDHLIDYVLLHELAHTKEKNHQKPFWILLDTLCNGEARTLDKELKNYNHLILR